MTGPRIRWTDFQRRSVLEVAMSQITAPHSMTAADAKRVLSRAQLCLPADLHREHFSAAEANQVLNMARERFPVSPDKTKVEAADTLTHHQVAGTPFVLTVAGMKTKLAELHQKVTALVAERDALAQEVATLKASKPDIQVDSVTFKVNGQLVVVNAPQLVAPSSTRLSLPIEMIDASESPVHVPTPSRPVLSVSPKIIRKKIVVVGLHPPQINEVRNAIGDGPQDLVFVHPHERLAAIKSKASGFPCFVYDKGTVNGDILRTLKNVSPYFMKSHGLHNLITSIKSYVSGESNGR